jgi:hypothetical protein
VSVVFTIGVIAVVAIWATAGYSRLFRLRDQVKDAWKLLEADPDKVAVRNVYNAHVVKYNAALQAFPAYLIAPVAGLKPAKHFEPNPKSEI